MNKPSLPFRLVLAGLLAMGQKARSLGKPEATRMVAENCMRLAEGAR